MNKARRKELEEASAKLDEAKALIETASADEQSYYDEMPENLQGSERGERAESAVEALDEAASQVEEAISSLNTATE